MKTFSVNRTVIQYDEDKRDGLFRYFGNDESGRSLELTIFVYSNRYASPGDNQRFQLSIEEVPSDSFPGSRIEISRKGRRRIQREVMYNRGAAYWWEHLLTPNLYELSLITLRKGDDFE